MTLILYCDKKSSFSYSFASSIIKGCSPKVLDLCSCVSNKPIIVTLATTTFNSTSHSIFCTGTVPFLTSNFWTLTSHCFSRFTFHEDHGCRRFFRHFLFHCDTILFYLTFADRSQMWWRWILLWRMDLRVLIIEFGKEIMSGFFLDFEIISKVEGNIGRRLHVQKGGVQ